MDPENTSWKYSNILKCFEKQTLSNRGLGFVKELTAFKPINMSISADEAPMKFTPKRLKNPKTLQTA